MLTKDDVDKIMSFIEKCKEPQEPLHKRHPFVFTTDLCKTENELTYTTINGNSIPDVGAGIDVNGICIYTDLAEKNGVFPLDEYYQRGFTVCLQFLSGLGLFNNNSARVRLKSSNLSS